MSAFDDLRQLLARVPVMIIEIAPQSNLHSETFEIGDELTPLLSCLGQTSPQIGVETGAAGGAELWQATGDIIALSPPLIISKGQIDELVGTIADVLKTAA